MRWSLAATLGFGALGASAAVAQSDVTEAQARQELDSLRTRIQEVQGRLEADRSKRGEAEQRIETLDRDIARLAVDIRRTEQEQAATRREIDRLDSRMKALREHLAAQKENVVRLAYSAYVMGRQSHLKLFLNQQEPAAINRMLGYHAYIVEARARIIEQINAWSTEIEALSGEQAARQSDLEALEAKYRSERDALQARREEREAALADVNERIRSSEDELARLEENENQLEQVLQELKEYLDSRASRQVAEGAFRSMQGRLRLPVSAPISAGYGETRATGVRWDGIMFRPENGDEVNAIFEGRVVFADWLRGFGLLLIINHGDGFMSLYSHNESLFKGIGDWVDTGEVIATVGTSGGLDKPGLYFEIRHDGVPQNPLSWCQKA